MLGALPLAADIAASVALSDRTETRLRDPGDAPTGPSVDVATTPDVRMVLASPRTAFTLDYAPRLTAWDINDVGVRPLWLHSGSARLEWRDDRTTLSLGQDASYGATNFAALTYAPTPEGTPPMPPRVDVIPTPQIIQFESSTTTLGTRVEGRRWEFRSIAGYQLSGGADDAARLLIPLQKGPLAEAAMTLATSPVDRLATTVTGSETTFSSGPEIVLGEGDEGWRHQWSAVTEMDLTLGVSEARVRPSPLAPISTQTNPVAEAILELRILVDEDRVTIRVGARLGPVVNRLLGIVDERVQGSLLSKWTHWPFAASAFASAQQSVPTGGPYATELLTGELGLSYVATEAVAFDVGVRGLWQRANEPAVSTSTPGATDITEASLVQGIVFVGATLRAPTMEGHLRGHLVAVPRASGNGLRRPART
jgi:hypothetical protein